MTMTAAIGRREHDLSSAPFHLSLVIANRTNNGLFMHVKEQGDLVPAGALEAIYNEEIPCRAVKTDVAPMGNRILQSRVAVMFGLDCHAFRFRFEPKQTRIRFRAPETGACHLRLSLPIHGRCV